MSTLNGSPIPLRLSPLYPAMKTPVAGKGEQSSQGIPGIVRALAAHGPEVLGLLFLDTEGTGEIRAPSRADTLLASSCFPSQAKTASERLCDPV